MSAVLLSLVTRVNLASEFQPVIWCDQPSVSFGTVSDLDVVEHDFALKNRGGKDLIISDVSKCCAVTVSIDRTNVAPEQSFTCSIRFGPRDSIGEQTRMVRLLSNDPNQQLYNLTLTGIVRQAVSIQPPVIHLGLTNRAQADSILGAAAVHCIFPMGEISVHCSNPDFIANVRKDGDFDCEVRVHVAPSVQQGLNTAVIVVEPQNSPLKPFSIPVLCSVESEVVAMPTRLIVAREISINHVGRLVSRTGHPFSVERVTPPNPALKISLDTTNSVGGAVRYTVTGECHPDELAGKALLFEIKASENETIAVRFVSPGFTTK
jgi:Protein of unknown function (DUF1573)